MDTFEEWSLIEPHLYLSGILTATNRTELCRLGIKRILTVDIKPLDEASNTADFGQLEEYKFIRANDHWNEDLLSKFNEAIVFLQAGQNGLVNTLVHCVGGVSRSATLVIAYLMKKYRWPYLKTLQFVKSKRSIVDPNTGFRAQLSLFERMGFTIDVHNKEYRKHLLNWLLFKHRFQSAQGMFVSSSSGHQRPEDDPLEEYFARLRSAGSQVSTPEDRKAVYKCKKCRLFLFNDVNVLKKATSVCRLNTGDGDILIIDPLQWMKSTVSLSTSGSLHCPHCVTKLGSFDWNCARTPSQSALHSDPPKAFKISLKKVDCHEYNLD